MELNPSAQAAHAALSDLESRLKAKGYDEPRVSLQFDLRQNWQFWLSLATDCTRRPAVTEYFYGNDLDDIFARAGRCVDKLPIDGKAALTAAMAPWFEMAQ